MQFSIRRHLGENLLLNRRWTQPNPFENVRVEYVNPCIDSIRDKFNGFFDEAFDTCCLWFPYNHTVFAGFFDFGDNYGTLLAVFFVELGELGKGIVLEIGMSSSDETGVQYTYDIGIEDKEGSVIFSKNLTGQRKWAGCTKGLRLHGESNSDIVFFFILSWDELCSCNIETHLFQTANHNFRTVIHSKNDIY
jgi:hypothetical protein